MIPTKNKLLAILGIILILGFVAVNFANYYVSRESVRKALIHNELPLTSNNIYSEIQASLLRPIYVSSLMANDTFLKDWMLGGERDVGKITKYLREIKERYHVFSTFVVSDITKRYYHFSGILKTVSPNVPKDDWFFSMRSYPHNYRVDVDTNEASGNELTIFINHKLYDYDGHFIGVTGLGLDAISVSELIQRYKKTYHRTIFFVDRDGVIKSGENNRIIDKVNIRNKPGIATVADQLLSGKNGFLEYPLNGDDILLTYRFIPELNWYLVVEQPESKALGAIRHALYFNIGVSLLITVIVLLISGYTVNAFQERLERMAKTDKLTGLVNRQYFDLVFENALKMSGRRAEPLSLIVFDVDELKAINDHYGHVIGDSMIRAVADAARESVRTSDVISRWGGDEFVILLPDCDEGNAYRLAEALRTRVANQVRLPESGGAVTISAGVARHRPGDTYESLLDRADEGLYRAKREGRNRVGTGRVGRAAAIS